MSNSLNIDDRIQFEITNAVIDTRWNLWTTAWKKTIVDVISVKAMDRIDVATTDVSDDWDQLDDRDFLSSLVPNSPEIQDQCATNLLAIGSNSAARKSGAIITGQSSKDVINTFLLRRRLSERNTAKLRGFIRSATASLIDRAESQGHFYAVLKPDFWSAVGHRLAAQVYQHNKSDPFQPDWLILNQLLLAEWLFGCQFSKAVHVKAAFARMRKSVLGIRGQLFRIPTHISKRGIDDAPPSPIAHAPRPLASSSQSSIVQALESTESDVRSGNGFFYEYMKNIEDTLYMRNCASLYEYTLLAYLATSSIEQLIRGYAQHEGIKHLKPNGEPIGVNRLIKEDVFPAFSTDTNRSILELFDTSGPNLRNRMMHGLLLDSESKWDETAAAATGHLPRSVWESDPFRPQNIFAACYSVLAQIDTDLYRSGVVSKLAFSWTRDLLPSTTDIAFASGLSSDLIRESNEGRLDDANSWVERLDRYAERFMPCLQHFATAAILGWYQNPSNKSLSRFCGFALTFEAVYRLTVHLLGFEVLQKSRRKGSSGKCEQLNFQTQMLDSRGIQSQLILDAIVSHVPMEQRDEALRCLSISIQTRNAFAHGAILSLPEQTKDALGNAFYKSLQTLVDCGLHHVTREAAYYNWLKRSEAGIGSPEDDWSAAEQYIREVFKLA